jgi:hypothetical protein
MVPGTIAMEDESHVEDIGEPWIAYGNDLRTLFWFLVGKRQGINPAWRNPKGRQVGVSVNQEHLGIRKYRLVVDIDHETAAVFDDVRIRDQDAVFRDNEAAPNRETVCCVINTRNEDGSGFGMAINLSTL